MSLVTFSQTVGVKKAQSGYCKTSSENDFFTESKCHQNDASLNNAMREATSVMIDIFARKVTASGHILTSAKATTTEEATEEINLQISCQHRTTQINCFSIVEMICQFLN